LTDQFTCPLQIAVYISEMRFKLSKPYFHSFLCSIKTLRLLAANRVFLPASLLGQENITFCRLLLRQCTLVTKRPFVPTSNGVPGYKGKPCQKMRMVAVRLKRFNATATHCLLSFSQTIHNDISLLQLYRDLIIYDVRRQGYFVYVGKNRKNVLAV
jgi:hypothetical protein